MKTITVAIGSVKVGDFMFVNGNRIEVKKIFQAKRSLRYLNDKGQFEKGTIVLRGSSKDDEWYAGPNGTALIEMKNKYSDDGMRMTNCCGCCSTYDEYGTLYCKGCYKEVNAGEGDGCEFKTETGKTKVKPSIRHRINLNK